MWKRNLLFLSLCSLGLAALGASLTPIHRPATRTPHYSAAAPVALSDLVSRVDQTLRQQSADAELTPVARADDLTIARRLSLALTGTIPSLEEIRLLEAEPANTRLQWWLDGLLIDRRSHDYLAERLARAMVGVQDGPFLIYRRRRFVSWLTDQLEQNTSYDQMVRQIIEATGLWTDQPATNFITVTIKPDAGKGPDEKELAARVSRAFLGIRMDCAECHDHPFEPWKQSDFQGLAAFFGQTEQTKFAGIQDDPQAGYEVENRFSGKMESIDPRVPFESGLLPPRGSLRHQLAGWVTHPNNKSFGRAAVNRVWAMLFGRPLIEPIDGITSAGSLPPAIDLLADDFVSHGYDLRRLIRAIALTQAFTSDSRADAEQSYVEITSEHEAVWAVFPITRLRPEQVAGALLQSASLSTIDYESHILVRAGRAGSQNEFIQRYGDAGEDEFALTGGTIPQRLMMMNGKQVLERTKEDLLLNAATRIALLAPTGAKAVETAYLAVLTRRPTPTELRHFAVELADSGDWHQRSARMEDLYWSLINSTEFSWNH